MNRFENAQNYVCGFAFDEAVERVVLIRKLKPDWQKGLLEEDRQAPRAGEGVGRCRGR